MYSRVGGMESAHEPLCRNRIGSDEPVAESAEIHPYASALLVRRNTSLPCTLLMSPLSPLSPLLSLSFYGIVTSI